MVYIVGLTGGIASGKSTVTHYLEKKNIPVIDADKVARQVVEPGTEGLAKVIAHFGIEFMKSDGNLNREKLGEEIFKNQKSRKKLGDILDEEIRQEIILQTENLANQGTSIVIWDIPLLFEKNYDVLVNETLLVYVDAPTQLQRLMIRDNISEYKAKLKINSQLSLEKKVGLADVIIDNNDTKERTYQQIDNWLNLIKKKKKECE